MIETSWIKISNVPQNIGGEILAKHPIFGNIESPLVGNGWSSLGCQ